MILKAIIDDLVLTFHVYILFYYSDILSLKFEEYNFKSQNSIEIATRLKIYKSVIKKISNPQTWYKINKISSEVNKYKVEKE